MFRKFKVLYKYAPKILWSIRSWFYRFFVNSLKIFSYEQGLTLPLYDVEKDSYLIARDHIGIIPLYIGWDEHGTFYVASELKALEGVCTKIELFPPGHYLSSEEGELKKLKLIQKICTEFPNMNRFAIWRGLSKRNMATRSTAWCPRCQPAKQAGT